MKHTPAFIYLRYSPLSAPKFVLVIEPSLTTGEQLEIGLRLLVALGLGASIGMEREYHGHPAGLRTMSAVAVGAALFTVLGLIVFPGKVGDPTRIAAQVVSGVGFLGAGSIFRAEEKVKGLTTAATIWVVAALGMAAGFGYVVLAIVTAALVLFSLVALRPLESRIFHRATGPSEPEQEED